MKKVVLVVALLCSAPGCFAQLTQQQKLTDFKALVALYDKNYGPFDWKKQKLLSYDVSDASGTRSNFTGTLYQASRK